MSEAILEVGKLAGLCAWDGNEWVQVACNQFGHLLVENVPPVDARVITANTTAVDFTGLDARNKGPYLLWGTIFNASSYSDNYFIYFNGDYTNSNYYLQFMYCDTNTVGAGRVNHPGAIYIVGGKSASFWAYVYLDARGWQRAMGQVEMDDPQYLWFSTWALSRTISAVNLTSIRIASTATSPISPGSRFVLVMLRG